MTRERTKRRTAEELAEAHRIKKERDALWRKENPEAARAIEQRSRARNGKPKGAQRTAVEAIVWERKCGPCTDCGNRFHPVAMDFDHVRGVKIASVSTLAAKGRPAEEVIAEIEKCELVCSNCHRVRTFNRWTLIAKQKEELRLKYREANPKYSRTKLDLPVAFERRPVSEHKMRLAQFEERTIEDNDGR